MYYQTPSRRQRVWSGAFWFVGLFAAIAALVWSPSIERVVHSRWVLGAVCILCFVWSGWLCGFWAAVADAIEEWFKNDDDNFAT